MKYRVFIKPPSAKRMAGKKTLFIQAEDGWGQGWKKSVLLTDETTYEFDVADDIDYIGETTCVDGMTFNVWVEYENSTGSRKETFQLVPQRI